MSGTRIAVGCLVVAFVTGCGLPPQEAISTDGGVTGTGTGADPVRLSDDEQKKIDDVGNKASTTDPRLSDSRAPLSGSGNYIWNQSAVAQMASFNITGTAAVAGTLGVSSLSGDAVQVGMTHRIAMGADDKLGMGTIQAKNYSTGNFDSLLLNPNGGFVGIGTTMPTAPLQVTSTFANTGGAQVYLVPAQVGTVSGTFYNAGLEIDTNEALSGNVTNMGHVIGAYVNTLRKNDLMHTNIDDTGTLENLSGVEVQYGHYTRNVGTTQNAYGVRISPYHGGGTITNSHALHLGRAAPGGSVGNYYGLYQEDNAAVNFFAGNVGIGTAPKTPLHIGQSNNDATGGITLDLGGKGCRLFASDINACPPNTKPLLSGATRTLCAQCD